MKDDRTPQQKYDDWFNVLQVAHYKGWQCIGGYIFRSPSGTRHDLSAADLTKLDLIEREKHFLIN